MDPATIAYFGLGAQGAGNLISALNPPSGPAQLNPEVAASLSQQGIDINQFLAQASAQNMSFSQALQSYGLGNLAALQDSYDKSYGATQHGATDFSESAFVGRDPAYLTNQIAAYGADVGQTGQGNAQAVEREIAQMGIDPSSPYAAQLRQSAQQSTTDAYNKGVAGMRSQASQYDLGLANNILNQGMASNRLAGTNLPAIPTTNPGNLSPSSAAAARFSDAANNAGGNSTYDGQMLNGLSGWAKLGSALSSKYGGGGSSSGSNYSYIPQPTVNHPSAFNVPDYLRNGQSVSYGTGGGSGFGNSSIGSHLGTSIPGIGSRVGLGWATGGASEIPGINKVGHYLNPGNWF